MGRFKPVENFVLPLASALMPIPSLAWVPVFILWFGLGNTVAILIVFYAALFPMLLNAWSGVRAVNPLWLRAAGAMGANERSLFWKVIIPGASPFIITGLRQAFLRAWIAVVGAEMLAASDWGLGWVIFDAKEFLNADVMMASLAVIGAIGFVFERLVFGSIEKATVHALGHGARGEELLQEPRRPHDRPPHMRGRAVVPAEAFLRLAEVAADDVLELIEVDLGVRIEGVDVVHADQPRGLVVLVVPRALVLLDDVRLGLVVRRRNTSGTCRDSRSRPTRRGRSAAPGACGSPS